MSRTLWLALLIFGAALSHVEAKVPVVDAEMGYSFELPQGFEAAAKSFPGHKPEDIRQCYTHPLVAGQPDIVCAVERLHGLLSQAPALAPAAAGQTMTSSEESWKSQKLTVVRMADAAQVTLSVGLPLEPEAVRVFMSGPAAREQRIRAALKTVLATLEGKTAGAPVKAAAAPSQTQAGPAKEAKRIKNPGSGTEKSGVRRETTAPPHDTAWWVAVIGGGLVACVACYVVFLRIKRLPPRGRYYALMAFGGGIALFSMSEAVSFGRGRDGRILYEGVVLGVAIAAFAVWCLWLLKRREARQPEPTAASMSAAPTSGPLQGVDLRTMTDFQIRRLGLCFLFLGAAGTYMLIVQPLQEAAEHKAHISYHESVLLFVPLLLGSGLLLTFLGKRSVPAVNWRGEQKSWLGVVVLGLLLVLGVVLLMWFKMKLREMGYDRPGRA